MAAENENFVEKSQKLRITTMKGNWGFIKEILKKNANYIKRPQKKSSFDKRSRKKRALPQLAKKKCKFR